MQADEGLEIEIARRGGRQNWEDLEDGLLKGVLLRIGARFEGHCRDAQRRLYTDSTRIIYFDFLAADGLEGFSYASPPNHSAPFDFIGITAGAVFTVMDIFFRMLSHPDIFPEIGNASLEVPSRCWIKSISTQPKSDGRKDCLPLDEIRQHYAYYLALMALDFLFYHELSHLRYGHLEWKADQKHSRNPGASAGDNYAILHQTLEWDADCQATVHTMTEATFFASQYIEFELPEYYYRNQNLITASNAIFGMPRNISRSLMFSIYTIFRIYNRHEWSNSDLCSKLYPPTLFRQLWVSFSLQTYYKEWPKEFGLTENEFLEISPEEIIAVEEAFGCLLNSPPDGRGITSVIRSDGLKANTDHLDRLNAEWKKLRPLLIKNKRGGNLPQ